VESKLLQSWQRTTARLDHLSRSAFWLECFT